MTWWVAGAVVVGGVLQSNAVGSASDAQAGAAAASDATQRHMYDTTRADNTPALEARNASLARMRELLGISGRGAGSMSAAPTQAQVQAEPGYQFGLQQGQQALQRQASARGMLNSGNALLAAQRYGQDYASTKYDNAFNRLQAGQTNTFNRLASVAGLGQTGANTIAGAGQNAANAISSNQLGVGNAQAAAGIAQANTWANTGNQLAGWYMNQGRGGPGGWADAPITPSADYWGQ